MGAIWVVLQDDAYNMVRQGMRHAFPTTYHETDEDFALGNRDLTAFAQSLGSDAYLVCEASELAPALLSAEKVAREQDRPQVVCVRIDRNEQGPFRDRNDAVNHTFGGLSSTPAASA